MTMPAQAHGHHRCDRGEEWGWSGRDWDEHGGSRCDRGDDWGGGREDIREKHKHIFKLDEDEIVCNESNRGLFPHLRHRPVLLRYAL
ncbi:MULTISPECIES: hypothetical protein [Streptomyces]|uniref:Uncharacterized protein n=1 Tax=Streptomyces kasugaensis TaxID=1946 RepID=A0A4Q9HSP9_STRKA|nr:hypothetical protein [Streptomyces kasugaensis]TBO58083.1 hypothetical protein EYS09_19295 [Streptomyces kasugaensis]